MRCDITHPRPGAPIGHRFLRTHRHKRKSKLCSSKNMPLMAVDFSLGSIATLKISQMRADPSFRVNAPLLAQGKNCYKENFGKKQHQFKD